MPDTQQILKLRELDLWVSRASWRCLMQDKFVGVQVGRSCHSVGVEHDFHKYLQPTAAWKHDPSSPSHGLHWAALHTLSPTRPPVSCSELFPGVGMG